MFSCWILDNFKSILAALSIHKFWACKITDILLGLQMSKAIEFLF